MRAVLRLLPFDPATGNRAVTRVETTPGPQTGRRYRITALSGAEVLGRQAPARLRRRPPEPPDRAELTEVCRRLERWSSVNSPRPLRSWTFPMRPATGAGPPARPRPRCP
ncbi:hypothetical protein ACFQ10_00995 [Streptomyces indonesiensis]